jgi:methylmalonyl-CoA mutase
MLGLDGGIYAHAGAAAVQQLGYLAAATVEYIRELSKRGVKPKEVFASLHWNLQVGPEFFMELAKLRASRVVWSNLVAAYGLKPKDFPPRIAARTGFIDKTIFDAHNNILRNSTEAFAAILGGAEAINIGAFDEVYRTPDAFSRRIAENVHLILREEMGLDRLIDPAGGAYAIESLTAELANKSWEKLQCIEKAGGFRKAITEGELQKSVAEVSAERAKRFSARRSVLIGTNRYAVAKEEIPSALTQDWESLHKSRAEEIAQLHKSQTRECASSLEGLTKTASDNRSSGKVVDSAIKAAAEGATLGEITKALREDTLTGKVQITPLRCGRLALPYERVRGLARKFGAKVTLICFGKLGQYKVRADWIREFCEAGGIEVDAAVIDSSDKVGAMLSEHPARATVICCDDETYPAIVPALAQAVKATQAAPQLYLAGAIPSELEAQWKSARLDGSISVKSNHLQTVEEIINLYK